jgi:phage baseplate assembly protein W
MPQSFLGVGWGFPVSPDSSGALAIAAYEESVRQAVWIVLGTAKGERAMRPDFGCGIHDLVFEQNTAATAGKVTQLVKETLLRLEPRIDLLDVQVQAQNSGEVLQISIDYGVRATNNTFNLVFPFYLEQGAAR